MAVSEPLGSFSRSPGGKDELYFIDYVNGEVVIACLKDGAYETFTRQTGSFRSRVLPGLVWDVAQLYNV